MIRKPSEKGQALILITFAMVGLVGFAALAIDGGRVLSDRRHAQNAADGAAYAAALASGKGQDITSAAEARATSNGYDGGTASDVTVAAVNTASGVCPSTGKEITVTIVSDVSTTFARVLGRTMVRNTVTATARACDPINGSPFYGNAIVSLRPTGNGFDAHGTPDWFITGGGIFVNSNSSSAATCGGSAGVNAPTVTAVGGTGMSGCYSGSTPITGAPQLSFSDYATYFPRQPACNGIATYSGGQWHPQSGADGSRVTWSGDADFAPGLYCVTNSPGPFHGEISGSEVTFYITNPNFSMKFNGGGNLTAQAPTSGEYKGVLMYLAPQFSGSTLLNTQELDMRGNGTGQVRGSIIAPSATVTMFGNSGTGAFNSQVIAYNVDSGGNADITVSYQANDNYEVTFPVTLTLLK